MTGPRREGHIVAEPVCFTDTGAGDSAVVLLHGFSDNLATWNRVVPKLAEHHRVLALDLPGFGGSARRDGPQFEGYLDAIDEVLGKAGVEGPVSLVGNSLGAITALLYAHRAPERVQRVVLIGMPGVAGIRWYWQALTASRTIAVLAALSRRLSPALVRRILARGYGAVGFGRRPLPPGVGDRYLDGLGTPEALLGELHRTVRSVAELRLPELVDSAPVPVLAVWGRHDLPAPARHAGLLRVRPDCEVRIIPGCGHLPQLQRPGELHAVVAPFLRSGS